jgi:hypothetical protein
MDMSLQDKTIPKVTGMLNGNTIPWMMAIL